MQRLIELLTSLVAQSKFDMGHEETGKDGAETIYSGNPEDTVSPSSCVPFFNAVGEITPTMEEH